MSNDFSSIDNRPQIGMGNCQNFVDIYSNDSVFIVTMYVQFSLTVCVGILGQ